MSMLEIWGLGYIGVALLMLGAWFIAKRTHDAGVVDAVWAISLALLSIWYAVSADGVYWRRILVALLASAWGFRLGYHLLVDRVLRGPEDGRYQALRASWQPNAERNFFFFFQAQALVSSLLSLAFLAVASSPDAVFRFSDAVAIGLWFIALGGESLADQQLADFRKDPNNKGKTCRRGLWRYSRHPNYFFEWLHWFTYPILALRAPGGILAWLAPLAMYIFIRKLSGIPYTEMQAVKSRGDDYRLYQKTTNAFFPWIPRTANGEQN